MNRYISKNYTTSKNTIDRQYTERGQLQCQLLLVIYTLSDLGDLSNLIGSLSRTIQQYSPPSEWIMCELGVFPIFLENDLTFFKARKDLEGFNTAFFNLLQLSFLLDGLCRIPVYSRRRSRFLNSVYSIKKIFAQKSKFYL